jgi:hypothetical protein
MNEDLKALLKKYKAILTCSDDQFIKECIEIVINSVLENHTISLKPIEVLQN